MSLLSSYVEYEKLNKHKKKQKIYWLWQNVYRFMLQFSLLSEIVCDRRVMDHKRSVRIQRSVVHDGRVVYDGSVYVGRVVNQGR